MIIEMRSAMGSWIMKGFLVIIALTFVVTFGVGSFSADKEVVAKVNGEEILAAEFLSLYNRELEDLRRKVGKNAEQLAAQFRLRENLLERMITNSLLKQYATQQRLFVSDEELNRRIQNISGFQQGGQFDYNRYQALLRQNGLTPTDYEDNLRADMLVEKLHVRLQGGVVVNAFEAQALHRTQREKMRIQYAFVDPQKFPPEPTPSQKALEEAYKQGGAAVQLPANARIRFFTLSLNDVTPPKGYLSDSVLKRYYESHKIKEFTDPEKVRLRQVFVPLLGDAKAAEQIGAIRTMEEVLAKLKKGGNQNFAALARKYSKGPAQKEGGDLGFVGREETLTEIANVAFSLKIGGVSEVVRSSQGLHILKVEARRPQRIKPFAQVKGQIENTLNERRAERKLRSALRSIQSTLDKARAETGSKEAGSKQASKQSVLQALAKRYKRPITTSATFDAGNRPAQLGAVNTLMPALASKKVGSFNLWQRNPVQGHVVYELLAYTPTRKQPLQQAKPLLIKRLQARARQAKAYKTVQGWVLQYSANPNVLKQKIRQQGLSIASATFNASQQKIPNLGTAPQVQKTAFGLSKTSPLAFVSEGTGQAQRGYVLWFEARIPVETLEKGVESELLRGLESMLKEASIQTLLARLRKQGDIDIVGQGYLGSSARPPLPN